MLSSTHTIHKPVNVVKFASSHTLVPPICNHVIQEGQDFLVMIVGGPNERADFHVNQSEEWFYQIRGELCLQIINDNQEGESCMEIIFVCEGESFLLPPCVPHRPHRPLNTLGLVVEKTRKLEASRQPFYTDELRWYCEKHWRIVKKIRFTCQNLQEALPQMISEGCHDNSPEFENGKLYSVSSLKCLKCLAE